MTIGAGLGQVLGEIVADGLEAILLDDVHRLNQQIVFRSPGDGTVKFQIVGGVGLGIVAVVVAALQLLGHVPQTFFRDPPGGQTGSGDLDGAATAGCGRLSVSAQPLRFPGLLGTGQLFSAGLSFDCSPVCSGRPRGNQASSEMEIAP